jgi:penicillin-binding protein 1A
VVLGIAVVLVAGAGAGALAFGASCDLGALRPARIGQNSFVYAADGSLLGAIPAERNREVVPLQQISPWLRKATIAVEDRRFLDHDGVDAEGVIRALWADLRAGEVVQGGSTITQQLVRNLYTSPERTVRRKLTEACLAVKLERSWDKNRILGAYLNQVYYGAQSYGAQAASQTYFSTSAASLDLREAALLAGLPQAPSAYDPLVAPERAIARRNDVLRAMREEGMIDESQYRWAIASADLGLRPGNLYRRIREPYFFGYVRDELIRVYGAERVRSGGLRVYTTIVPRWQRLAQQAIRGVLTEPGDPASAVISIDPATGAIRAMAEVTPGRAGNQFNLVTQARRQPGSTFKTFVLAAAVERGIDPSRTFYVSAPFTYRPTEDGSCEDETWWCVKTYDSSYYGWTSIRSSTLRSDNAVFAQLTLDVTPKGVADVARRLGVRTPLDVDGSYVPAIGLGSVAVSPLDMASAYATLAAGGVYVRPTAIRRVVLPGGREDTAASWGAAVRTRVLPDGVALEVTRILEENVRYGTGTRAQLDRPVAGKTGTTDDHADAWFVGYTPDAATAVWVGHPRGEVPMDNVHGIAVSGGSFPAQIWQRFMQAALADRPARAFPEQPVEPVEWQPFERGPHALSWDPLATETATETETEAETSAAGTQPAADPRAGGR